MTEIAKREVSISMTQANVYGIFFALPAAFLQVGAFTLVHGIQAFEPKWNLAPFVSLVILGIVVHEVVPGLAWAMLGNKPFSAIKFSLVYTSAVSGDWLVLWLIRPIKLGSLAEDYPTNTGCYVLENA